MKTSLQIETSHFYGGIKTESFLMQHIGCCKKKLYYIYCFYIYELLYELNA